MAEDLGELADRPGWTVDGPVATYAPKAGDCTDVAGSTMAGSGGVRRMPRTLGVRDLQVNELGGARVQIRARRALPEVNGSCSKGSANAGQGGLRLHRRAP